MKLIKEIVGKNGFVYFKRWRVLSLYFFYIDVHEFFLPPDRVDNTFDKDDFLHNHPRLFISVITKGGYDELFKRNKTCSPIRRFFVPGNWNFVGPRAFHKIESLLGDYCSTIVFTTRDIKSWGYLDDSNPNESKIISNEEYRQNKHET